MPRVDLQILAESRFLDRVIDPVGYMNACIRRLLVAPIVVAAERSRRRSENL